MSQEIHTIHSLVKHRRGSAHLARMKPEAAAEIRDGLLSFPAGRSRVETEAFRGRNDITSLFLPEGVEEIGDWAFNDCKNLAAALLPERMREIGFGAFWGCRGLVSFRVPEGVQRLDSTFVLCENLERISLPSTLRVIDAAFSLAGLREVFLPNGLEAIGPDTFNACRYLREISIPDSVSRIGAAAFANCPALRRVALPASFRTPEKQRMLDEAKIPENIRVYR